MDWMRGSASIRATTAERLPAQIVCTCVPGTIQVIGCLAGSWRRYARAYRTRGGR
jgi:hypothetical protein